MSSIPIIPQVIDQHSANASSLWQVRDRAVASSSFRLADLERLDGRIEANLDGLRVAATSGWSASLEEVDEGAAAADFFVGSVLAAESGKFKRLEAIIEQAYANATRWADKPYLPAYDPWRGLVSALAWIERIHAARAIERLIEAPRARTRWLAVAACGARRIARAPRLEAALTDPEPLVRARAARTAGELGRIDLRALLNTLLEDPDGDCRFWGAWSATRLGTAEGVRALAGFVAGQDRRADLALDHLLRCLSIHRANALLHQFSRDPRRRLAIIRASGAIGDPVCMPWLLDQMDDPAVARAAGDAFANLTGAEIADLARSAPPDAPSRPSDDPAEDDVGIDPDEDLAWPDPKKVLMWWQTNGSKFTPGTAYFLGVPKQSTNWIAVLHGATQGYRRTAAFELALRRPGEAMFEVRARGDLQRRLLERAGGVS